ncbi:hypothetical protein LTS08_005529 [Lithohypha guttulata]|nr:hypothetical protein LTS08_005529 [Lithohypha guttulata]
MPATRRQTQLEEEELEKAIQASLREESTRKSTRKAKPRLTKKRVIATIKAVKSQSRAVKKAVLKKVAARPPKLKTTLKILYSQLPYNVIRKFKINPLKKANDYWPWPRYPRLKLGHNAWQHLNWRGPTEEQVRHVHELLTDHHAKFEFDRYVDMPAHATKSVCTVDVIIQTMFAQSTDNAIAIDVHSRLCNAFPYTAVDGRKYVGKIPNWHDVRHIPPEELKTALKSGGLKENRAKWISQFLNDVYDKNLDRRKKGISGFEHDGNPPGSIEFVPGMLSMDYLTEQEDNSDEALIGRLTDIGGIGLKSASCILAFALKRPIFVVDTHVLRMSRSLGWVPQQCNNVNEAAMFLHAIVPDDIKYDLHNQIWTHCANENNRVSGSRAMICGVCGANPPPQGSDAEAMLAHCPLTKLLPSLEKRWGNRYKLQLLQARAENIETKEQDAEMKDVMKEEVLQGGTSPPSSVSTPKLRNRTIESFFKQAKRRAEADVKTPLDGKSEGSQSDTSLHSSSTTSNKKKQKKLDLRRESIRFEEVPEKQVEDVLAAGYLLWEFRPMDNTFMEEWGKVDQFPRFRWERDDVMDKDVAVTYEYAKAVLEGRQRHKWSAQNNAVDIATNQTTQAVSQMPS